MKFRLHYHISNNGDGSVSVRLHETQEAAEQADSEMEDGWGEPCNGHIDLTFIDGKLSYTQYEYNETTYEGGYVTKQVEEIK